MNHLRTASDVLDLTRSESSFDHRILIVEDEMLIALGLTDILDGIGASWVMASRVDTALGHVANETFDAAIVDLNLGGQSADAVMDALDARGIPFVITTGYTAEAIAEKFRKRPVLIKPYMRSELERALLRLLEPCRTFALTA